MNNAMLKSKKGKTMVKEELLAYLLSSNMESNLSILYKDGKPTLVHKYNSKEASWNDSSFCYISNAN